MQTQELLKLTGAHVWKVQLLHGPVQRKVGDPIRLPCLDSPRGLPAALAVHLTVGGQ